MKVRVGPYDFPIHSMDTEEDSYGEALGEFHVTSGIEVDPNQSPSMVASTILHEALHAIWEVYRLPKTVSEEAACTMLEGPLLAFLRDNRALLATLVVAADQGHPINLPPPPAE